MRLAQVLAVMLAVYNMQIAVFAQPRNAVYMQVDSFSFSEPVPIDAYFNEWEGASLGSGSLSFTYNRAELGFKRDRWQFSLLYRYDYRVRMNQQTAEFYHRIQNKQVLPEGESFALDLDVMHQYSTGLGLGYRLIDKPNFSLFARVNYLRGRWLVDGRITGNASVLAESDYDFALDVDYAYSEDSLFDRVVDAPTGHGVGVDLDLHWSVRPQTQLQLEITDLFAEMIWDAAPVTYARANSQTKTFDADGFVQFRPVLSGIEKTEKFRQKLPLHASLGVSEQLTSTISLAPAIFYTQEKVFYRLLANYVLNSRHRVSLGYDFTGSAVQVGYQGPYTGITVVADDTDLKSAHTLRLSANLRVPF